MSKSFHTVIYPMGYDMMSYLICLHEEGLRRDIGSAVNLAGGINLKLQELNSNAP